MTFNDSKRNTYAGVLGSKAVGEQAMMMGVSVIFALRRAIDAVRRDLGQSPLPFYTLGIFTFTVFENHRKSLISTTFLRERAKRTTYIYSIKRALNKAGAQKIERSILP